MRQVEHIMGMPITIDIPGLPHQDVFSEVFGRLRGIDKKFSTYIPGSEVSLFRIGRLREADLSREFKQVISACRKYEAQTDGYFSAWYDGNFDPSGYVKGWAISEAGKLISRHGCRTFCISAGGDILAASDGRKQWGIGIQDPTDSTKILNKLSISNGAVATSGNYERGEHIYNPRTKKTANDYLSVTVTGPDIIVADVLATAIFAMGTGGSGLINKKPGYRLITVEA